ncbi:hypothetical protein ABAC402_17285 [Asticcacaulis sp. AC402]|nr:hypothetical protein ABAC402_17285 [Asticcacaulis sp. AC402]
MAPEALPMSRSGAKRPTSEPEYGVRAMKALARLMDYGSERVRLGAAKAILRTWAGASKRRAAVVDEPCTIPVVKYIQPGQTPPPGEFDDDTWGRCQAPSVDEGGS